MGEIDGFARQGLLDSLVKPRDGTESAWWGLWAS